MLKTVVCRFNSISSRNLVRISRNLSVTGCQFNKENGRSNDKSSGYGHVIALASLPTFLAFFQKKEDELEPEPTFWDKILPESIALLVKKEPVDDETTPEGKLKSTLKRAILAVRKKEFDEAEKMVNSAIQMAQEIQNYDGITLCYDIMGNLAFDREQYEKAKEIFESVLQRLYQKGVPQDDIQILHLSLKLAQLADLQGQKNEAKTNYAKTVKKLDEKSMEDQDDEDLLELKGLASRLYAKFLIRQGKFKEALPRMEIAQGVSHKLQRKFEREYVDIVHDLAILSLKLKDYDAALQYIDEAIVLASAYPEIIETGIYHAEKAIICIRKGLLDDAKRMCDHAKKASERSDNADGKEQAKHCMEEFEKAVKRKTKRFYLF